MPDSEEKKPSAPTVRERFHNTLVERASKITSVRNDVYTLPTWQLALNLVLVVSTVVLLIISMTAGKPTSTACLIAGLCDLGVTIIYNIIMKLGGPSSFLQYTELSNDKKYCYRLLSKKRASFSDGEVIVEYDRGESKKLDYDEFARYRYDFFADMDADIRIGKADKEIFKGTVVSDGRTFKCSITFKNGAAFLGKVGGARIKYFDVNNTRDKFTVPYNLKNAVKEAGVEFPKLPGIQVFNKEMRDFTKSE